MQQPPNRLTETEELPLGQISISLGSSDFWSADRSHIFAAKIKAITSELIEKQQLGLCGIIRRVVVATEFEKEVGEWQQSLGCLVGTTNTAEGMAAGKTFVWGDGAATSTYGVIVIRENVAAALLDDEPLVCGLVAHEFAHAFDDTMLLRGIGKQPHPSSNDWPGIRRYLAITVWSEFFAETVAFPFFRGVQLEPSLKLAADMLRGGLERAALEVLQYRLHTNVGRTWGVVCQEASQSLGQMGRALGQVAGAYKSGDDRVGDFGRLLARVAPEWNSIAESLWEGLMSCSKQDALTIEALSPLETQILEAFHHFGAFPRETANGLWVDFP